MTSRFSAQLRFIIPKAGRTLQVFKQPTLSYESWIQTIIEGVNVVLMWNNVDVYRLKYHQSLD